MKLMYNEEAVSPVIGVILMVAITVILAAVIAAFVFGMAGSVQSTKNVAATATQQGKNIIVTYQGGPDHNNLEWLNITWPDSGTGTYTTPNQDPDVGTAWTNANGTGGKDHVVVTAAFGDGSQQVILDTYV